MLARLDGSEWDFPRLKVIFADADLGGEFETKVKKTYQWLLEIVRRPLRCQDVRAAAQALDCGTDICMAHQPAAA